MVYGLYALSPVTGFLATVAGGIASTDLIPASGDQDHTISPSAKASTRLTPPSRPSHPASDIRDDREAPSVGTGWTQTITNFGKLEVKFLRLEGSTGQSV